MDTIIITSQNIIIITYIKKEISFNNHKIR